MPGDTCAEDGVGLTWQRSCISFSMQRASACAPTSSASATSPTIRSRPGRGAVRRLGDVGLEIRQTNDFAECAEPEYNPTAAPTRTRILFVEDWSARELPPDAFGLTLVWHNPDTGEIYDADMQINETLGDARDLRRRSVLRMRSTCRT